MASSKQRENLEYLHKLQVSAAHLSFLQGGFATLLDTVLLFRVRPRSAIASRSKRMSYLKHRQGSKNLKRASISTSGQNLRRGRRQSRAWGPVFAKGPVSATPAPHRSNRHPRGLGFNEEAGRKNPPPSFWVARVLSR